MTWVAPIIIQIGFRARILNKISTLQVTQDRSANSQARLFCCVRTISERLVASLEYRRSARLVAA